MHEQPELKPSAYLGSHASLSTCVSVCLASALMVWCAEPREISRAVKHNSKKSKQTLAAGRAVTCRSDKSVSLRDSGMGG